MGLIPVRPDHHAVIAERQRAHAARLCATPTGYAVRGTSIDGQDVEFRTLATSSPEAVRNAQLAGVIIDPRDPLLVSELPRPSPRVFVPVLAAALLAALIIGAVRFIALRALFG